MNINKIGIYDAKSVNFGKNKRAEKETNTKDTNNKKDGLAMGALALTGMLYMAYKNRKLNADVDALKKQIFSEKNAKDMPEEVKETVQKIADTMEEAAVIVIEEEETPNAEKPSETAKNDEIISFVETQADVQKPEIQDESKAMSFEKFQKAGGSLHNGKAYINYKLYSGDVVIQKDDKKIQMNYKGGELKRTDISVKNNKGEYEPSEIRIYTTNDDGQKIIEVYKRDFSHRKTEEGALFFENWKKAKIIQVSDSKISIQRLTHFNDYLGTYFRKQKDGSWKGYYETREYNDRTKFYDIISRDINTDKKLSKREVKKLMA